MERKRNDAVFPLIFQVERRRLPERGEERIPGERARRQINEPLGQLERLRTFVDIETKDKIRLHIRDVPQDHIDMIRHFPHFVHAGKPPRLRFFPKREPRLNTREKGLHPVLLETLQVLLRKEREAAFRDEVDRARRDRIFDGIHATVELDAEIGIMKRDQRAFEFRQEEPQILFHHREVQRLERHNGIDAEAAGIRAAQAPEHRDHLYHGRFPQGRVDELPSLPDTGQV